MTMIMTTTSNNKAATKCSPYFSMTSFAVLIPASILYSIAMRVGLHLLDRCRHPNPQLGAVLPLPPPPLSLPSSGRRVAIVTGSNTGIGYETARTLVVQYGYTVILACQSRDKALAAAERINAQVTMANPKQKLNQQFSPTAPTAAAVFLHPLDLSNTASIRAFCAAVADQYSTIHVLINNAGRNTNGVIIPNETDVDSRPQQAETSTSKAGGPIRSHYDLLFHSNFLGHFLLTRILVDTILLRQTDEARIVNLSSVMHHFCAAEVEPAVAATKLHSTTSSPTETEYPEIAKQTKCTPPPPPPDCSFLGEVEFWKDVATAGRAPTDTYALSKLAAILFTLELNRRYSSSASNSGPVIRSLAVNPGSVLLYLTNEQGCRTSVVAAVSDSLPPDVTYLQPYWLPGKASYVPLKHASPPFPMMEMLGPYVGYRVTQPRLPADEASACNALWTACDELTNYQQ